MKMPDIRISFIEIVKRAFETAGRGTVVLIVKDNTAKENIATFKSIEDIPEGLSEDVKKAIKLVFKGTSEYEKDGNAQVLKDKRPTKVYVVGFGDEEDIDIALKKVEPLDFNFIAYPTSEVDDASNQKIINFIKKIKKQGQEATAVISSKTIHADSEDIVNFVVDDFVVSGETIKASSYTGRIAGILAATPFEQSVTYMPIREITSLPEHDDSSINAQLGKGELTLAWKKGCARIARGINTLTTKSATRGDRFKKIKLVNIYKFINNSIYKVIIEEYIGKIANSYDNKCLLMVEIKNFLNSLVKEGLIQENFTVGINLEKQKEYLKAQGEDIESMKEQEIKEANTGSNVFLAITLRGIDAMEDFDIEVNV